MSLSIGILGLPNVGKSTLFKALTKKPVDISNYPFCTIEPNVGVVEVPDERLEKLAEVQKLKRIVPSFIKFLDVAGLVKGAAQGEGLGNQFLAHLKETDVLLEVVRCFKDENVSHVAGIVEPKRDIEIIKSELILKDLETVKNRLQKIEKDVKAGGKEAKIEFELLTSLEDNLKKGNDTLSSFLKNLELDKREIIKGLFLLAAKPKIYLLNCNEKEDIEEIKKEIKNEGNSFLRLDLREELDKSELTEKDREELGLSQSQLDSLIKKCYEILDLITFFTIVGEEEARAWPIKKGSTILEGAGKVHSDFREKFIKAEVINWQELLKVGDWKECARAGLLKTVGRDYILEDGDVIEIKHG